MTVALVAGAIANKPGNGGAAWTRLSWALGMRRLGFDIHFVERLASGLGADAEMWFESVVRDFALAGSATLLHHDGTTAHGLSRSDLADVADEAVLLLNISGHLTDPDLVDRVGTKAFIDLDPGYTQTWHAFGDAELAPHDHWYSVGTLVGTHRCSIPTGDVPWRPTLQPVLLDEWPAIGPPESERFTTVAAWRGPYGPVQYGDQLYGSKAHEFRRFISLPRLAPAAFELTLDIHPDDDKDRAALEEHGWLLADPADVAANPQDFRRYVQRSTAELSVAQALYVHTTSGWFSDRTARYLASARPAVVQDTGIGHTLELGEGLLTFRTLGEAVTAVESVLGDYEAHRRAARALAEEHLAAEVVIGRICEEVGVAP